MSNKIAQENTKIDLSKFGGDNSFEHSNAKGKTYRHTNYTLSYCEEDEQAEWVGYELTYSESNGKLQRNDLFTEDPDITTRSAQPYEYRDSGYDRGHLAPSADMRFDETAMNECFYMSIVSPQKKEFNAGIWNDLEMQTRSWARHFSKVYVVSGPILNIKQKRKLVYTDKWGKKETSKITIPEKFYKIIFDYSKPGKEKMIAFCLPNEECQGSFFDYAVTVDKIEEMTGIDFFCNLPNEVQAKYESEIDIDKWKPKDKSKK